MTLDASESGTAFIQGSSFSDIRRTTAAVANAFTEGARAVLVDFSGCMDTTIMREQRIGIGGAEHPESVIVLITTGVESSGGLQHFLGPCYFSEETLTWTRQVGYRYGDEGALKISGYRALVGADALLVPRAAWSQVGGFDVRVPPWLSTLEWSTRARAAGFDCYARTFLVTDGRVPGEVVDTGWSNEGVIGAYRLAWKHHLPCSAVSLFSRRVMRALVGSYPKPRFRKDYGITIGPGKRIYWYLRNLRISRKLVAASREALAFMKATTLPRGAH